MKNNYRFSPEAREDLRHIAAYIAKDNPHAARAMVTRFHESCETIASTPYIGHYRTDLTQRPLRFFPVGRYLIVYQVEARLVRIIRVISAYRDIGRILS